jgi:hypothetical protein
MTKPALVIGNGPSVDLLTPNLLDGFATYGCNHIYKKFNAWGRQTDVIVITDSNRVREIGGAYVAFQGRVFVGHEGYVVPPQRAMERVLGRAILPLKQLPKPKAKRLLPLHHLRIPIPLHPVFFDKLRFSLSMTEGLNFGYSVVTSAIQLAVIDGHKRICLTGVDSHYKHDKSYFEGMQNDVSFVNKAFTSNPRVFMEPVLVSLQLFLEPLGIELLDCTPGGALRFIAKSSLE